MQSSEQYGRAKDSAGRLARNARDVAIGQGQEMGSSIMSAVREESQALATTASSDGAEGQEEEPSRSMRAPETKAEYKARIKREKKAHGPGYIERAPPLHLQTQGAGTDMNTSLLVLVRYT